MCGAKDRKDDGKDTEPLWVWIALIGISYIVYMGEGQVRIFGMFFVDWIDLHGTTPFVTSWVGFIFSLPNIFLSPFLGFMADRWPMRSLVFASGVIGAIGMMVTAWAPNIGVVILGYGILYGLSDCISMSIALALINKYFDRHLALASGIAWCAGSIGGITMPFIIDGLNHEYSSRGTLMIIAGIRLNLSVAGMVLRPVKELYRSKHSKVESEIIPFPQQSHLQSPEKTTLVSRTENNEELQQPIIEDPTERTQTLDIQSRRGLCCRKAPSWTQYVTSMRFVTFSIFWFGGMYGFYSIIQFIPPYLEEKGFEQQTALLLGISGGADLAGRILFGAIGDLRCTNINVAVSVNVLICGSMAIVVSLFPTFPVLVLFMMVMGCLGGSLWGLCGPLVVDAIGREHAGLGGGIINSLFGISTTIHPLISGALREVTGSYNVVLYIGGAAYFISFLSFMVVGRRYPRPSCLRSSNYPTKSDGTNEHLKV